MNKYAAGYPRFSPVGEGALLVTFADELSPKVNHQVRAIDQRMQGSPMLGVIEWIPAYASILVLYDPLRVQMANVKNWVASCFSAIRIPPSPTPKRVDIPVRYGGVDGPDLPYVADYHGLSPAEVVEKHVGQVYCVGMMGFLPGFAYLMGLNPGLATPRLDQPRPHIPAGSVGIAGMQTGIYPLDSPGGWQLIGRTDLVLFDPLNEPHFTLSPGDEVRFVATKGGIQL
jgi:KipI family sensor histidine kinase inhibitor